MGRAGRPSKSLTLRQAEAVLKAAEQGSPRMRAYIVVSLLTGARTEEMRALRWCDVDLAGQPDADPPVPPHLVLVRSVRAGVTPRLASHGAGSSSRSEPWSLYGCCGRHDRAITS